MGAANKITNLYALRRTVVTAYAASCALGIIYGGKIVVKGYGTGRTLLYTKTAADATVFTDLSYLCALVVVITLNNNALGILDKMNYAVGTFLSAKTAADALLGINLGDMLLRIDADSISRTNLHTVAVAKTSKGTISVTCEEKIRAGTGKRA